MIAAALIARPARMAAQSRRAAPAQRQARTARAVVVARAAASAAPSGHQKASVPVTFTVNKKVGGVLGRRAAGGLISSVAGWSRHATPPFKLAPAPAFETRWPPNPAHPPGPPRTASLQVHFGQQVVLVGSHERLGAWCLDTGAVRMAWTVGNDWSATLELPLGAELEYKFAVVDPEL